ncbi:MAG: hypothetical protein ACTHK7_22040 [Aureliella sp.]
MESGLVGQLSVEMLAIAPGTGIARGARIAPLAPREAVSGGGLRQIFFGLCCLIIALVSVHDAALIVLNYQVIAEVEMNPLGRWLLELQGGEVWLFVLVKLAGTAFVWAVLVEVYRRRQRYGLIAAGALTGFQLGLLCYLTLV